MVDPDIQTNANPTGPSHLVVEQGLFARSSSDPATAGMPTRPQAVTGYDMASAAPEETEQKVSQEVASYENGGGSAVQLIRQNLFWVLLIPMVIIEVVLLIMVIRH